MRITFKAYRNADRVYTGNLYSCAIYCLSKKRLLSDYATLRVRMDIRYQLACLYHEQKDDERVYEQLRWLENLQIRQFM